jgi:hypothetical protein
LASPQATILNASSGNGVGVQLDKCESQTYFDGSGGRANGHGKIRSRREASRAAALIPPPDNVFIAAAKNACIQAGLSQETIDILHPPSSEPGVKLPK